MKTIYKYTLAMGVEKQLVQIPRSAQILSVKMQNGFPVLWALVETENMLVSREIFCILTGVQVRDDFIIYNHISTIQLQLNHFPELVFHFFSGREIF